MEKYNLNPKKLLDIACGTCNNALLFNKEGIAVTGVDTSKEMLDVAKKKIKNKDIEVLNQSFLKLDLQKKFDAAICFDFSTGHILNKEDFERFLINVYEHLENNAIFVFDIKPNQDYNRKFSKYSEFNKLGDYEYKWEIKEEKEESSIIKVSLTLREMTSEGIKEIQKSNYNRTYSTEEVKEIISKTPFKLQGVYKNYKTEESNDYPKFWVFVLRKI